MEFPPRQSILSTVNPRILQNNNFLKNPNTNEPWTTEDIIRLICREGTNCEEPLESSFREGGRVSIVDDRQRSIRVYGAHLGDLMTSFHNIVLINAGGINPEADRSVRFSHVTKGRFEIRRDCEVVTINCYESCIVRISPLTTWQLASRYEG